MTREKFGEIEAFMLGHMRDSAHDSHHVYRVLNAALSIAESEEGVDMDVLLSACLLHDIGREREFANPALCHARIGGDMAYEYLISSGWDKEKAARVRECIASHRYRSGNPPQNIEAKILFDADKLDVTGAIGIARTLMYEGRVAEALYALDGDFNPVTESGEGDDLPSTFFHEYNFKLKKLYGAFYTRRAGELAAERQAAAEGFYQSLYREISTGYQEGNRALERYFGDDELI